MKLGIIVVYLFDANTVHLLDLHLNYIRKFTDVPYTIYGSVSRLHLKWRQKLSEYPEVRQYDLPPTDLREGAEHAYYLNYLSDIAIQDGATHVVALHLDSFPVSPCWVRKLRAITDQTGSCVALEACYTACLFFTKDFYLRYRPKFEPVSDELEQSRYLDFVKEQKLVDHSGTQYLYICSKHHLTWHMLKNTTRKSSTSFGDICGGMIFHFNAATRFFPELQYSRCEAPVKSRFAKINVRKWLIDWIVLIGRFLTTPKMRKAIRKYFSNDKFHLFEKWLADQRSLLEILGMQSLVREKLIRNPDSYLFALQNSPEALKDAIQEIPPLRSIHNAQI